MKLGIVGLPNVGKSTLFNAITKAGAEAANYPFCTIEPNVGVVNVPDDRLERLREIRDSKRLVHTSIEFYDIAGLVQGASKGEGLGNQFLSHIREVEAIVHVVRCFEDPDIVHVSGQINPLKDIEDINTELIFSDLEILDRRLTRANRDLKADRSVQKQIDILEELIGSLEKGILVRNMDFADDDLDYVDSLGLLTGKPVIYVANISEDMLSDGENHPLVKSVAEHAKTEGSEVVIVCGKIEAELAELEDEEKAVFLEALGIAESGLDRLIKASYKLLDLVSFMTTGPKEIHAWTIVNGTTASRAAGKIHSDFERGFIRAETIAFDTLAEAGSFAEAREKGLIRSEGKDYVVKDGDVIHFLFNV